MDCDAVVACVVDKCDEELGDRVVCFRVEEALDFVVDVRNELLGEHEELVANGDSFPERGDSRLDLEVEEPGRLTPGELLGDVAL